MAWTRTILGVAGTTVSTVFPDTYVGELQIKGPRPWVDVRAHGAKGDGVTDDTTAIQAALDAVPATVGVVYGGAVVFFPRGTYLSGKLTMNTTGYGYVTLLGEGRNATTIKAKNSLNDTLLDIGIVNGQAGSIDSLTIRHLRLDGNYANQVSGNSHGLVLRAVHNALIHDVLIEDFRGRGIYMTGNAGPPIVHTTGVIISSCHVLANEATDIGNTGIYIDGATDGKATDWMITDTVVAGWSRNFDLESTYTGRVSHCWSGTQRGTYGVLIVDSQRIRIEGMVLDGAHPTNARRAALSAVNTNIEGIIFRDCFFRADVATGLVRLQMASGASRTIKNCRVEGCLIDGTSTTGAFGIQFSGAGTFSNNTVAHNDLSLGDPAFLDLPASGVSVFRNPGFVTENSGTGSIASGATTAVVTHGLAVTPTLDDISIVFGEQGTADYGRWWVDTITSTQFTLRVSVDPGASNLDFAWRAVAL